MKKAKEICLTTTMQKVKEGGLLVDVRTKFEVKKASFNVPNYINIPLDELEERINEIPKDKEIVMVCRVGDRSLRTTYFLMNTGYDKVYNLSGGIVKWTNKNFPTKGDIVGLLQSASCDCSQTDCC